MSILFVSSALAAGLLAIAPITAAQTLLTAPAFTITVDEVRAEAVTRLPVDVRAKALTQPTNVVTLANDLAMRRALSAEAIKDGLDRDPIVALQLKLARERVLAEAKLARIDGEQPDRSALEKVAQAEYRANADSFLVPEKVRVRHILIDERSCDAGKRIAQLRDLARAPGADFGALAREHSQDPGSAKRGGDLGFIEPGRTAAAFEKAAFALAKPGDVSEVVRTEFGLHIIRLEERQPASRQPFEKVRAAMVQDLINREIRNRRRQATEPISGTFKFDMEAVEAFAKQPH